LDIFGNTSGLSPSEVKGLERLYERVVPMQELVTNEVARDLAQLTHSTGRQVGILVDRSGRIQWVIIGDASKLMLPDVGRLRGAEGRLRGLRLIHTHLRNEPLTRDDIVDLTRLRLDLIVAVCLAPEGTPMTVYWGHNTPVDDGHPGDPYTTFGPLPYAKAHANPEQLVANLESEFARLRKSRTHAAKDGRAILIHVADKKHTAGIEASMRELSELARTAGVDVADTVIQVRDSIDPKFILGKGKLDDVVIRAMQLDAEVLIFDRNLSPSQIAAISRVTDLKVIDRTQLILDIFAQRAESADGKLQVELAQMKYLLPRLSQKDDALSRLTGGIGGRGPGETKLEVGKRRARERIQNLEARLKTLGKQREQRRSRRHRRGVPIVAIVGYTNAGKSTLLNTLTDSDVIAENKLFATLDTRSRRIRFPEEREVIITDTVGFIRDLPKDLFTAFRATFEEAQDADLLLHVVDASDPSHEEHVKTTEKLLAELELDRMKRLLVYNKADRVDPGVIESLCARHDAVAVTAFDRATLRPLLERLGEILFSSTDAIAGKEEGPEEPAAPSEVDAELESRFAGERMEEYDYVPPTPSVTPPK
jgi:GTP-binding protein HflX